MATGDSPCPRQATVGGGGGAVERGLQRGSGGAGLAVGGVASLEFLEAQGATRPELDQFTLKLDRSLALAVVQVEHKSQIRQGSFNRVHMEKRSPGPGEWWPR